MPDILFHQADLRAVMEGHEKKLFEEIDRLPENRLLNIPVDDLCKYFVDEYTINVPKLNEAGIQADYGDTKVDVSGRFDYGAFDRGRPVHITGTRMTFFVPFEGNPELFKCRPSTFNYNPPRADVRGGELVFTYERTASEAERIEEEFKRHLNDTKGYLSWIERDVAPFNAGLPFKACSRMEGRRDKVLKDRGLAQKIGYPLRRRESVPETYATPQVRRKATPQPLPASTAPFAPEPTLDMQEYEYILSIVSNMVLVMERSPQAFRGMKEEDLRQHFLVQLNGHYEGQATGETFNFAGKTDILIRANGKNVFVAECKFWEGPKSLTRAIEQLLGYASWRDTKTALLIFNRGGNLTSALRGIPEVVKAHPSFKKELPYNSETGFRYVLRHRDDPNRELFLTILVFEVPA